jgi:hypothetical protein
VNSLAGLVFLFAESSLGSKGAGAICPLEVKPAHAVTIIAATHFRISSFAFMVGPIELSSLPYGLMFPGCVRYRKEARNRVFSRISLGLPRGQLGGKRQPLSVTLWN